MSAISEAREAEKMVKIRFEEAKKREWLEVSASVKEDVARAVWRAKAAGTSVSQICREYGTSDRNTIYAILKRQEEYHALVPDTDAEASPVTVNGIGHDGYEVTVPETGETVYVKVNLEFGAVVPILHDAETITELHKELMAWRFGDSDAVKALIAATGLHKEV